jgi:SAM-dependent methyltransferase
MQFDTLRSVEAFYRDDTEVHRTIFQAFTDAVQLSPELRRHRDHIEQNALGFGDRAFHWLWKLLVDEMPGRFRFLEIGVYKGQVLSLVGMLAMRLGKVAYVFGITPLDATGDKYSQYQSADYPRIIGELQTWAGIPAAGHARILCGSSTDDAVKSLCRSLGAFDMVYIDGSHDFHAVASDIIVYSELLRVGGYLIMDDAATDLRLPPDLWAGHAQVSLAATTLLGPDKRFKPVCSVGHNRVWRKVATSG